MMVNREAMIDPEEIPENVYEGEILQVNGEEYEAISVIDYDLYDDNRRSVTIRLHHEGSEYRHSHSLKLQYALDEDGKSVDRESVLAERVGSHHRRAEWEEEVVESFEAVTREETEILFDLEEGDMITFNDRSRPLEVVDVSTTDVTASYSDTVYGERVRVECEGTWSNASRYRLYRYTTDMHPRMGKHDGFTRVEKPQVSSTGAKKFLKHGDLEKVELVEGSDG